MGLKIDFLFYSPDIEQSKTLDPSDSLHAIKVLRMKKGDNIQVTDGKGGWYHCLISDPNPKVCKVEIVDFEKEYNKPPREIAIAICPTKNSDRIEYFVEKSVEIGVSEIIFLKTQNTYPKKINTERIRKIAISAMKQSLKAYLPKISDLVKFDDFIKNSGAGNQKFMAHYDENSGELIKEILTEKVLILIGPEGDFTIEEIKKAKESNFKTVTLGKNRLRTETAGVVSISILNLLQ